MPKDNIKVIEKHYIEVTASAKKRFLIGVVQGLGWGLGVTLATSAVIITVSFLVSKVDFVPIFGQFLSDVIKSAQATPRR